MKKGFAAGDNCGKTFNSIGSRGCAATESAVERVFTFALRGFGSRETSVRASWARLGEFKLLKMALSDAI